jgi:spore coat protein U-like protein
MKQLLRCLAVAFASTFTVPAWSAINCTIVASPSQVNSIYASAQNLDVLGTFTVNCTRLASDARRPDIWVGLNQPAAGGVATLDTGGSTLPYTIAHRTYASGIWTNTGGVAAGSTTAGGVTVQVDFGNRGITVVQTFNYYLRIPLGLTRPAGVYVSTVPVTLRLGTTQTGTPLNSASLDIVISIPKSCRFSTPPTAITVNYPAFSAAPITGASNFAMTCTQGTTYTIALDATRGLIPNVQLSYGLSLSAASAAGSALAQPYTVNISVDARQAGRCTGSTCSGTDSRTLTVTY